MASGSPALLFGGSCIAVACVGLFAIRRGDSSPARRDAMRGCAVELVPLEAADYRLSAAFAVARMAAPDFVDSLLSRRLFEQLERMSRS